MIVQMSGDEQRGNKLAGEVKIQRGKLENGEREV